MTVESESCRERAAADRAAAAATNLPNVRARLLQSAETFESMAERAERIDASRRKPTV